MYVSDSINTKEEEGSCCLIKLQKCSCEMLYGQIRKRMTYRVMVFVEQPPDCGGSAYYIYIFFCVYICPTAEFHCLNYHNLLEEMSVLGLKPVSVVRTFS